MDHGLIKSTYLSLGRTFQTLFHSLIKVPWRVVFELYINKLFKNILVIN